MDSITQAALGAAVGEAVLGKKAGNRAMLWGAVAGTLPDLDVLAYPFLDTVGQLYFHRGPTHSLVFAPLVAPLLGWAVSKLHRDVGWTGWAWLFFWALWTHPMLDALTVYGTQLLWPITNAPFALPSLFIIDPLYTVWLLVAVLVALFLRRERPLRRRLAWAGLGLSTAYAAWSLGVKTHVEGVVRASLERQGIAAERVLTTPAPLQTVLWNAVAEDGDRFHVGLYGLLDDDAAVRFRTVPRDTARFAPAADTRAGEVLRWFSSGWWAAQPPPDSAAARVVDLRFGRADGWLSPEDAAYVFAWDLVPAPGGALQLRQLPFGGRFEDGAFAALWDRIRGDERPAPGGDFEEQPPAVTVPSPTAPTALPSAP